MEQENEMDRTGPHSEFSELEIYLQECDFSRLRERDWHRIGPRTLGIILSHRPELYEICRNLITLQPESWSELLQVRPDLAEECDCWGKFSAVELVRILKKQPQLARYVLNWKTMNEQGEIRFSHVDNPRDESPPYPIKIRTTNETT